MMMMMMVMMMMMMVMMVMVIVMVMMMMMMMMVVVVMITTTIHKWLHFLIIMLKLSPRKRVDGFCKRILSFWNPVICLA